MTGEWEWVKGEYDNMANEEEGNEENWKNEEDDMVLSRQPSPTYVSSSAGMMCSAMEILPYTVMA